VKAWPAQLPPQATVAGRLLTVAVMPAGTEAMV
jgi:hypothetical protein